MTFDVLGPRPELLREEFVLVQAWKKTASYIRYHNWFSDTLELDRILDVIRQEALRSTDASAASIVLLADRDEWARGFQLALADFVMRRSWPANSRSAANRSTS